MWQKFKNFWILLWYRNKLLTVVIAGSLLVVGLFLLIFISAVWTTFQGSSRMSQDFGVASQALEQSSMRKLSMEEAAPAAAGAPRETAETSPVGEPSEVTEEIPTQPMVVKTGALALVVEDVEQTAARLQGLVATLGGYVSSAQISDKETPQPVVKSEEARRVKRRWGHFILRVPVDKFDQAWSSTKDYATKVERETISTEDVGQQYADLEARIANLRSSEAQLREIMKRSGKVSEILEVQRELSKIQGEIERLDARKRYLENRVSYATITVDFSTAEEALPLVEEKWEPLIVAKKALRQAIEFWQDVADKAIWLMVFGGPFVVLGGLVWLVVRLRRRFR